MSDDNKTNDLDPDIDSVEDSTAADDFESAQQPESIEEHKKSARRVIEARAERKRLRDELDYLSDLKK